MQHCVAPVCSDPQNGARFSKTIDLRGHMPRFTQKMNVFPSISWETQKMCVQTLRTVPVSPRQLIWGVTCLSLVEKFMFPTYVLGNTRNVCWNPQNRAFFFWDDRFEGPHAEVYSQIECFPIYLLRNPINVCCNPQNSVCFSKMINLRCHMPRFT